MRRPSLLIVVGALLGPGLASFAAGARADSTIVEGRPTAVVAGPAEPLAIGETFTFDSTVLGETRRVNVYRPRTDPADLPLPVLYLLDGGIGEDFLHVAGLIQVSVGNGTMRPFLLVGIENTERRRDLTGPTEVAADREIAPRVGGSAAFRELLRTELMPEVARRHRTTGETAIVGESLAGLFVIETFFLAPELFDAYVAVDPSLWWNDGHLVETAGERLHGLAEAEATLYLANSAEPGIAAPVWQLVGALTAHAGPGVRWHHQPMPEEQHRTIFHPALLEAFRTLFAPAEE